jgi:hypothetical protein
MILTIKMKEIGSFDEAIKLGRNWAYRFVKWLKVVFK